VAQQNVQIYAASSVDNYLAPADGSVDWLTRFDDGTDLGYDAFYAEVGSMIVGRSTFDQVLGFGEWPYRGKPVTVLTRSAPPEEVPTDVSFDDGSDLRSLVTRLKEEASRNVWLIGGGAVHRSFLREGLVDEIWTHVLPILLGDGIPMFPPKFDARDLSLIEAHTYKNGATLLRYGVAGSASRP
jgi:dihydrofolate reductase